MDSPIYVGKCPVCHEYGMLEVVINVSSGVCSVMCDECYIEWKNPEEAINNINGSREINQNVRVRTAKMEEVKEQGWEKYVT